VNVSRPTFRTDIPVAPLSAAQANQETLDRIRRLKANGLEEFSDPPRMPWISPSISPPWASGFDPFGLMAGLAIPALYYFWAKEMKR